jgi:hypothetical protein
VRIVKDAPEKPAIAPDGHRVDDQIEQHHQHPRDQRQQRGRHTPAGQTARARQNAA